MSKDEVLDGMHSNILPVCAWAKLYKRDIIKNISYPPLRCTEDKWTFVDVMERCGSVSFTEHLVYYYQRSDSTFRVLDQEKRLDIMKANLRLTDYLMRENKMKSAATFYAHCISIAFLLEKVIDRTKLFKQYFDRKTRQRLLKGTKMKTRNKWYGLFVPYSYKIKQFLCRKNQK